MQHGITTGLPLDKGYTDKILYINVGTSEIKEKDVPPVMKEKFIGGKGYGLRLAVGCHKTGYKMG